MPKSYSENAVFSHFVQQVEDSEESIVSDNDLPSPPSFSANVCKQKESFAIDDDDGSDDSFPSCPQPIDHDDGLALDGENDWKQSGELYPLTPMTNASQHTNNSDEYFLGIGPGGANFNCEYYCASRFGHNRFKHKSFSETELHVQFAKDNYNSGQSEFSVSPFCSLTHFCPIDRHKEYHVQRISSSSLGHCRFGCC